MGAREAQQQGTLALLGLTLEHRHTISRPLNASLDATSPSSNLEAHLNLTFMRYTT